MSTPAPVTTAQLRDAFRTVYDPEFGVSIEDLGLIYDIELAGPRVHVTMSLTSMYCPAGQVITEGVRSAAEAIAGVGNVEVELVWNPPWTPDRLSPAAREQLGWDEPRLDA
jgi:metal-sulfur cluster biosynthetic enzyme